MMMMQVKLSVLKNYLQSATAVFPCIAFVALAALVAAQVSTNIWLSEWTLQPVYNGTTDPHTTHLYLGVYGALGVCQSKNQFLNSPFFDASVSRSALTRP